MDVSVLMVADISIAFIVVLFLHKPSPSVADNVRLKDACISCYKSSTRASKGQD